MKRVRLGKLTRAKRVKDYHHRPQGRPQEYFPNERDRKLVCKLVKYAIPVREIASQITNPHTGKAIDTETLYKYYREDMDRARIRTDGKVSQGLNALAIGRPAEVAIDPKTKRLKIITPGLKPDINAIRWYEMTRKGFSEKSAQQQLGKDGLPIDPNRQTVVVFLPANRRDEPADPLLLESRVIDQESQIKLPRKEKAE